MPHLETKAVNCCVDWEPETKKLNAPLILAQARNPHLTATPELEFKPWFFCPWCGCNRKEVERQAKLNDFIVETTERN